MGKKTIIVNDVPDVFLEKAARGLTSLGNNPAFPNVFDGTFIERIMKRRFKKISEKLESLDIPNEPLETYLQKIILKTQELEKPNREVLEKLCLNFVIDLFQIPADMVEFNLSLKDTVVSPENINVHSNDTTDNITFKSVSDAKKFHGEVYKRRLLNALAMGAGMWCSELWDTFLKDEIDYINPQLCELYKTITILNEYLIFTKEINLSDKDKRQMGFSEIKIGGQDKKVNISVEGMVFPALLSETVRGCMDLFNLQGLPKDEERAMAIIKITDYVSAEPWDMRIGPALWELFLNSYDEEPELLPYVFNIISQKSSKNFNFLFKEIFMKTKRGKDILNKVIEKAKKDMEYADFENTMNKMKTDKNLIIDEFFNDEEL